MRERAVGGSRVDIYVVQGWRLRNEATYCFGHGAWESLVRAELLPIRYVTVYKRPWVNY